MTAAPRYPIVLFDWDGSLAMTHEAWFGAFVETFHHFGISIDRQIFGRVFGNWRAPLSFGVSEADLPAFNELLTATVDPALKTVGLYPGARALVEDLQAAGARLALITSSTSHNLKHALANSRIAERFDLIVTAEDVADHKPHPEGINKALHIFGGTPKRAVMVGDTTNDLQAANSAGTDSLLLYPPSHAEFHELEHLRASNPTYVCVSFDEARGILLPNG